MVSMTETRTVLGRIALAVFLLLYAFGIPVSAQPSLQSLENQTRAVIEKCEKSVVSLVICTTPYDKQSAEKIAKGKLGRYSGSGDGDDPLDLSIASHAVNHQRGNGVVLTAEGLILCPYHLIDGATKIYVRSYSGKGSYADIHAADSRSDLAVLRLLDPIADLTPAKLPEARPGKFAANRGDFAVAISSSGPDALNSSLGLVTAVDKKISIPVEPVFGQAPPQPIVSFPTLLLVDARSARGVSGGGIFNLKGELIGITTAVAAVAGSDQAPGYVIPMDRLYQPIVALLQEGIEVEYGFLGVTWDAFGPGRNRGFRPFGAPQMNPARINPTGGVIIGSVAPGMPAQLAGIHDGDTLLAVNGFPLSDMDELQFRVGAALATGDTELTIRRSGRAETETVTVRLAKATNPLPWLASRQPEPVFGFRVDHLSTLMQDLYKNENPRTVGRMPTLPNGVVAVQVEPGSPAEKAFPEPNRKYIITKVNGKDVSSPREFYSLMKDVKQATLTVVTVNSSNGAREVTLP
ncbi:MAG: site-2 protease family protein [Gemmataceae bacterium]